MFSTAKVIYETEAVNNADKKGKHFGTSDTTFKELYHYHRCEFNHEP